MGPGDPQDTGLFNTCTCAFPLKWEKHTLDVSLEELQDISLISNSIFCSKCIDVSHIRV